MTPTLFLFWGWLVGWLDCVQHCSGYSGSLLIHVNFRIAFFYLCEESHWNFDGNCIQSKDYFE
jgi:hypothetical protein